MARYLTKKRRNIKKYKKSRTGRGKGGRSIKRHTVGKRRRMVGGDDVFDFNVDPNDLQVFMSKIEKYTSPFRAKSIQYKYISKKDETDKDCAGNDKIDYNNKPIVRREEEDIFGFEKVELVAKGFALVTKMGSIFSANNRKEQINVFACYMKEENTDPLCYAIVRCAKPSCKDGSEPQIRLKPNSNMESKILFLFIKDYLRSNITKLPSQEIVNRTKYNAFTFTTRLSSDEDEYKILVPEREAKPLNLNDFFNAVTSTSSQDFKSPLDIMSVNEPRIKRECLDPGGSSVGIPLV
jgi:hypothetical protein